MLAALLTSVVFAAPPLDGAGAPLQQAKLVSPEPDALNFGRDVALGGDWLFVLQDPLTSANIVLVYRRIGGDWTFQHALDPTHFRGDPRLDFDGVRLAVGGRSYSAGNANVFNFDGSGWVHEAELSSSIFGVGLGSYFGSGVSIAGDRMAVGADEDLENGYSGFVTVFDRTPNGWVIDETIDGTPISGCGFGSGVAVSGDWMLVRKYKPLFCPPAAYLFERTGSGWQLRQTFANGSIAIDLEGVSLAVGPDLYRNVGGSWQLEANLPPGPGASTPFLGASVALDGETVAVGDPGADGGQGAVFLYRRVAGTWTYAAKLTSDQPTTSDVFGADVDLSAGRAATGARSFSGSGVASAAYVHVLSTAPVVHCLAKTNSQGCLPAMSFSGSASLSSTQPFDLGATQILNAVNGILFYGYGTADIPFQGGALCVSPPAKRTAVQNSGGSNPPALDCSGQFSFDMNAYAQSGIDPILQVGTEVSAQYWYRDPADPAGFGAGLSDAVEFVFCP